MKHYKSHIALFSFSGRFCTTWWLQQREPTPQAGQKQKALPTPGDEAALDKHRNYQKRTSTKHYRYQFSWRRAQMSLRDHLELSAWPRTFPGAQDTGGGGASEPGGGAWILFWATWTGIPATPVTAATSQVVSGHFHSTRFSPRVWFGILLPPGRLFSLSAEACTPAFGSGWFLVWVSSFVPSRRLLRSPDRSHRRAPPRSAWCRSPRAIHTFPLGKEERCRSLRQGWEGQKARAHGKAWRGRRSQASLDVQWGWRDTASYALDWYSFGGSSRKKFISRNIISKFKYKCNKLYIYTDIYIKSPLYIILLSNTESRYIEEVYLINLFMYVFTHLFI